MNVAVVVPTYNQAAALPGALRALKQQPLVTDVIVVDNGSTDKTFAVAQQEQVKVAFEPRRGDGQACRAALRVLPSGTEVVAFVRVGQIEADRLAQLIEPLRSGAADLVIGAGGAQPMASRLACRLISMRFGRRVTTLGPLHAIRVDLLRRLSLHEEGSGWDVELQMKALKAGLRVIEVPIGGASASTPKAGTGAEAMRSTWDTLGAVARNW